MRQWVSLCPNKGSLELRLPYCPLTLLDSVISSKPPMVAEAGCRIWLYWDWHKESKMPCLSPVCLLPFYQTWDRCLHAHMIVKAIRTSLQPPCYCGFLLLHIWEKDAVQGEPRPTLWHLITFPVTTQTEMNANYRCENLKHLLLCEPLSHSVTHKKASVGKTSRHSLGHHYLETCRGLKEFLQFWFTAIIDPSVFCFVCVCVSLSLLNHLGELPTDHQIPLYSSYF